jgi:hypothetical protein
MRGGVVHRAVLAAFAALATAATAGARAEEPRRPWYLPDQAKLQLAGNVGFLSPGVGYAFARRRLEADLFFGWVPKAFGGENIYSITAKLTWLPWSAAARGWTIRPLTAALQLTNTFGEEYFIRDRDGFPSGYHVLPPALRAGVAVGGAVGRPLWGLRRVGVYYELVAVDVMLGFWVGNREALDLEDVVSLALGVRVEF